MQQIKFHNQKMRFPHYFVLTSIFTSNQRAHNVRLVLKNSCEQIKIKKKIHGNLWPTKNVSYTIMPYFYVTYSQHCWLFIPNIDSILFFFGARVYCVKNK